MKDLQKKIKTFEELVNLKEYEKAIEISQNSDDFTYLFFKVYNGMNADEDCSEMLNIVLDYAQTNYTSNFIADIAYSLEMDSNNYAFKSSYYDVGEGLAEEIIDAKSTWSERFYLLAINKSNGKDDDKYINESLQENDKSIEDYLNLDYIKSHKYVNNNRKDIQKSKLCVCVYCMEKFPPSKIEDWISNDTTAICPYCSVDSVLGDFSVVITDELIRKMYGYWFT